MKKNFKISLLIITLLIIIMLSQKIFANTNLYASVLYSDNMGGSLSEQESSMNYAKNIYENLGYTTFKVLEPSELLLTSNLTSSNVLLFFSHGDMDSVTFDNTGLITSTPRIHNGIYHMSTNSFNWTAKKLVIFCACNTAGNGASDTTSITGRVVDAGAQTAIGWYDQIYSISTPDWLDNFHDKLSEGVNPLVAVNYANGEYYLMSSTRSVLVSYRSLSSLNYTSTYIKSEKNILNSSKEGRLISLDAENLIKEYDPSFNIKNYTKTTSEGIYLYDSTKKTMNKYTSYVDYNYTIGDYILNSGYTVVLNKDDNIIEIIDNTKEFDYNKLSKKLIKDDDLKESIKANKEDEKTERVTYFYDIEKDKKYMKTEYINNSKKNEIVEIN